MDHDTILGPHDDEPRREPQREPRRQRFNFIEHESVEKLRSKGVWTDLGEAFGSLLVRIRPFYSHAVVVRREAAEEAERMKAGLGPDEPLPADKNILVNRAAVIMALTGAKGGVVLTEKAESAAVKAKLPISHEDGVPCLDFAGDEDPEQVREVFNALVESSFPLLSRLVRASQELQKVKDEEIARLGEDFVFGQHVKLVWAD